jgi:hypothetical protein
MISQLCACIQLRFGEEVLVFLRCFFNAKESVAMHLFMSRKLSYGMILLWDFQWSQKIQQNEGDTQVPKRKICRIKKEGIFLGLKKFGNKGPY